MAADVSPACGAKRLPCWPASAPTTTEAGRNPYDRSLTDLIGELVTRSETFRTRWAAHNVRMHRFGTERFNHPAVGQLSLTFEAMALSADDGLTLAVYTAEPESSSADGLRLLATWAASRDVTVPDRLSRHRADSDGS
nr:DNA-binding protein [Mycobacterium sp. URHD0025]